MATNVDNNFHEDKIVSDRFKVGQNQAQDWASPAKPPNWTKSINSWFSEVSF
jgi:hypothetical protein